MEDGVAYNLNFDLAANLPAGSTSGTVEIIFNGEVIDTVSTNSGVFDTHSLELTGTSGENTLTFHTVATTEPSDGPVINTDGAIYSYEKTVEVGGEEIDVAAFAPGQNGIYQVIDGDLHIFDPVAETYTATEESTGFKINAIGFNVEDDLIYGIAKGSGVDANGNDIAVKDVVMMDATGAAYKVGETHYGDYVGDFDDSGNLYTFHTTLDRVTKIDVDNIGPDGNPVVETFHFPKNLLTENIYDIAYNASDNSFYGVSPPKEFGGDGSLIKIDLSTIDDTGSPVVTQTPITGTLYDDGMQGGMVKGAYGAVVIDGDGNIYAGLNRGDHDMDTTTAKDGGIFKINIDPDSGSAYAEFVAEAPPTGSNDGAIDPRSIDPFTEVDTTSSVMLRAPELTPVEAGGDDDLRGAEGDDVMFGGGGDDVLYGGADDDKLSGDSGADKLFGGTGDDVMSGGAGKDYVAGGEGSDDLSGNAGDDRVMGGAGDDVMSGGEGSDKLVGGSGADTIEGGAGDDHMWGGNWWKDGDSDTFVVSSGSGKDMIHDFETEHDALDLSSYGIEFSDLSDIMTDKGWATEIDLSGLEGGKDGDKLILKSVDADDLDESNFIL